MSYQSMVLKVFIASPSDVLDERKVIREMIYKWNNINSEKSGIILQPVGWETHSAPGMEAPAQQIINETLLDKCDILVGVLWSKLGTPTEKAVSGTVEEIDRHIASKKTTMLYFLKKDLPYDLDVQQKANLLEYKDKLMKTGLITIVNKEEDIGIKFYDQLCIKMNEFKESPNHTTTYIGSKNSENEITRILSKEAKELLVETSHSTNATIIRMVTNIGPMIQTNGKNFVTSRDPREVAKWEEALKSLEKHELVETDGYKREVFVLTNRGFQVADAILKSESDKET